MRRASAARSRRPGNAPRRFGLVLGAGALAVILAVVVHRVFWTTDSFTVPSEATLAALSVPQRIVAVAQSQVGYATNPSSTYCNKFSAYWNAGSAGCPSGERSEEWCADLAWAWRKAGQSFTCGYRPGEINGGAASFYEWGVATGKWHPATSGFVASPGDVAVYGLSLGATPSSVHVAIVTDDAPGQVGPGVVNGDGHRTGFSVVETVFGQALAPAHDLVFEGPRDEVGRHLGAPLERDQRLFATLSVEGHVAVHPGLGPPGGRRHHPDRASLHEHRIDAVLGQIHGAPSHWVSQNC